MSRLRTGLTGLAVVFLIVLLASALLSGSPRAPAEQQGEPLAVLGVAPGTSNGDAPARADAVRPASQPAKLSVAQPRAMKLPASAPASAPPPPTEI